MTPVDDLHVNNWIAVCYDKRAEPDMPFWGQHSRQPSFTGQPLQIIAISLPFIAVRDGRRRFSIDIRDFGVRKLHPTYVRQMKGSYEDHDDGVCGISESGKEDVVLDEGSIRGLCPMCGEKLRERRLATGVWVFICDECGFEGGQAEGRRT